MNLSAARQPVWKRARLALAAIVMAAMPVQLAFADAKSDLAAVEAKVAAEFPALNHMEPDALTAMVSAGQPVMIFDVREEAEYAVSHLAGATRVAPDADPAAFVASIAAGAKGKSIVFYCSVGMRSSKLGSKAAPLLMSQGAASVNNLRGGIFRWSNEGRPLEKGSATPGKASKSGVTVHPYNANWGRLIAEPQAAAH
jgi:rhodanese-related sulfurtransferase